jgi:hypothetical protein
MATQIVGAIGLAAALVAVYYAWRMANLARLERREARLRTLVEAVLEVRSAADEVFVAYDLGRSRAETTAVVFAFHQAQDRLRLAVESGRLPAALVEDELVLERLRALLDRRPLNVVKAAAPCWGTRGCSGRRAPGPRRSSAGCASRSPAFCRTSSRPVAPPEAARCRRRRARAAGSRWSSRPPTAGSCG